MKITDLPTGSFVADTPADAEITWAGQTFTVQVRRLSFAQVLATADLPTDQRNIRLVADCIVFGNGEQLTEEQAAKLAPALASQFMDAIAKANTLGAEAGPKA